MVVDMPPVFARDQETPCVRRGVVRVAIEAVDHGEERRGRRFGVGDRGEPARGQGGEVARQSGRSLCLARAPLAGQLFVAGGEGIAGGQQRGVVGRRAEDPHDHRAQRSARLGGRRDVVAERLGGGAALLADPLERGAQRIALVAKVAIERPVREPGLGRDRVGGDGGEVARFEQALEGVEEPRARVAAAARRCGGRRGAGYAAQVRPAAAPLPARRIDDALDAVAVGPAGDRLGDLVCHLW